MLRLSGWLLRTILICFFRPEKKDKEDLEELSTELELADEDELVP